MGYEYKELVIVRVIFGAMFFLMIYFFEGENE